MGYFDEDHLASDPITAGPSTGFLENFWQARQQQRAVDSPFSREVELRERWQESLDKYEQVTGKKLPRVLDDDHMTAYYIETLAGNNPTYINTDLVTGKMTPQDAKKFQELKDVDRQITELNDPNIPNFSAALAATYKMQNEVEAKTGDITARQNTAGFLGSLAGGMVGSFSLERDPVTVLSTPFGGFGRTAARRIVSEMAIVGASVAASEGLIVNPKREAAGLPERSILQDTLLSAAFAGLIRGGFEGGGKLLRLRKDRLAANESLKIADEDAATLATLAENPQSPRARAGIDLLTDVHAVERVSPYGTGRQGMLRFTGELDEVAALVAGQTDTAVARALPEVPFEFIQRDADLLLVQERAPDLYARLEQAKAKVAEIEAKSAEISASLERTTLPDAVRLVDQEAASQLDDLAKVVNDPATPEPVRAAAELQAEAIVQRVGVDRVAKALNDAEIAPKAQIKRLKAERKAAVKRYREVYGEVEAQRGRMQQEKDFLDARQNGKLIAQLASTEPGHEIYGHVLRREVASETVRAIDTAADVTDDAARRIIEPPENIGADGERIISGVVDENGMVDIGLEARVPGDRTFSFIDENGTEQVMTFAEALRELRDDLDLDNSVRTCAL